MTFYFSSFRIRWKTPTVDLTKLATILHTRAHCLNQTFIECIVYECANSFSLIDNHHCFHKIIIIINTRSRAASTLPHAWHAWHGWQAHHHSIATHYALHINFIIDRNLIWHRLGLFSLGFHLTLSVSRWPRSRACIACYLLWVCVRVCCLDRVVSHELIISFHLPIYEAPTAVPFMERWKRRLTSLLARHTLPTIRMRWTIFLVIYFTQNKNSPSIRTGTHFLLKCFLFNLCLLNSCSVPVAVHQIILQQIHTHKPIQNTTPNTSLASTPPKWKKKKRIFDVGRIISFFFPTRLLTQLA